MPFVLCRGGEFFCVQKQQTMTVCCRELIFQSNVQRFSFPKIPFICLMQIQEKLCFGPQSGILLIFAFSLSNSSSQSQGGELVRDLSVWLELPIQCFRKIFFPSDLLCPDDSCVQVRKTFNISYDRVSKIIAFQESRKLL